MVRLYKRTLGSRKYKDYPEEEIERALKLIVEEGLSITTVAKDSKFSYGTLYNRYKGLHMRNIGHPTYFTMSEEEAIIKAAVTCGDWGYPMSKADVQNLAKNYLDRQGKAIKGLEDNKPGTEWVNGLLKRHKGEVCQRLSSNIKRARATVSIETLKEYFNNLEVTLKDVPATNVFNYDETNFADDPGKQFKLYRKGVKYPEKICNYTKSSTTVMMCGSVSGTLLPPYVIFRSVRMWTSWTENGPRGSPCCNERCCSKGARYNNTQHGWIDAPTFTDWFMECFLPHARRLEGKVVIIGDNLVAHSTDVVLKACEEFNISFVCLVPNSTHLTQPLDVSFFRPMKIAWRKMLLDWKSKNSKQPSLPKEKFPNLLQATLKQLDEKQDDKNCIQQNLKSGFAATGIFPFHPERVLSKIPGYVGEVDHEVINSSLVDLLREQRFGTKHTSEPKQKRKRMDVVPGKSICARHSSSSESDSVAESLVESEPDNLDDNHEINHSSEVIVNCDVGDYVLVKFPVDSTEYFRNYMGQITEVKGEEIKVNFMRLKIGKEKYFTFPNVKDEAPILKDDIVKKVPHPSSIRRGKYYFKNLNYSEIE